MANEQFKQSSRMPSQQGGTLARGYATAEHCVSDHPASAVGVAFGVGLGLGLCVGLALKSSINARRVSHRRMSERVGRQVLEAMSSVLPESLSKRMQS